MAILGLLLLASHFLTSCADSGGGNNEASAEEEAVALWDDIHAMDYRSFDRAPGYATTQTSVAGAHGDDVDIYINPTIADVLAAGDPLTEWPLGSLIVKDGFRPTDTLYVVAVMQKHADGWFWAEYYADGEIVSAGMPSSCLSCHVESDNDYVWAFPLP